MCMSLSRTFHLLVCVLAAGFASSVTASAGKTPEDLARTIKTAIVAGDLPALLAAADLADSPPVAQLPFVKLMADCVPGTTCSVTSRPLDPTSEAELRDHAQRVGDGLELPAKLDGVVEVAIVRNDKPARADAADPLRLAYAKVGGEYKVEPGRLPVAKLAKLRATTARAAAEATLAEGIYSPATHERDRTWPRTASALPADGGEPGKALLILVKKLATAVAAEDVDAAAALLGDWGNRILGATDRNGAAVPLANRRRRLQMQARRFLLEVRVLGGWQRGDDAILIVEGVSGSGWLQRGATRMSRVDGQWRHADGYLVEVPPN